MRRITVLGLVSFVLVSACGGDRSAAEGDGPDSSERIRIALIAKSSNNPVFLAARAGAEAAARELSGEGLRVEVEWLTPPQEDGQVQAQRIQQAVNSGVDAVLIAVSDAGRVTGAINDAVDRGVPVMTFDSDAPDSRRFAFYGVDDIRTGEILMAELAAHMNGQGDVAILAGNQNAPNLQRRVQGVRAEAAKYPGIRIVNAFYHTETPQDAAAEVIRVNNAYPTVAGWAMIGGWPLFTQALLTDIDPAQIKVVAIDALPAQLAYVDQGVVPVLFAQGVYEWGYVGVRTIVEKIHEQRNVPEIIPMELVRVNASNLGDWARQLRDWGFTDVSPEYLNR